MSLTQDQILDIAKHVTAEYNKGKIVNIMPTLQRHEIFGRVMKQNTVSYQGGSTINMSLLTSFPSGATEDIGLYHKDEPTVPDLATSMSVPWRWTRTNYSWDEGELALVNGDNKIADLLKSREMGAVTSRASHYETRGWSSPSSSTNKLQPWGIPHYVVKNATEGFYGQNPSGWSDTAGIDAITETRWRNRTGTYSVVSRDDLIYKLRDAMLDCAFMPVTSGEELKGGSGQQYRMYTNKTVFLKVQDLMRGQNDNLGVDLANMEGSTLLNGSPFVYVPYLNADTQNPVYGINFSCFHVAVNSRMWEKRNVAVAAAGQSSVFTTFINSMWNMICTNRREQFVLYAA